MTLREHPQQQVIKAIARREGTARELAERYGCTIDELRAFAESNREAIANVDKEGEEQLSVAQLNELWITNKYERLRRIQEVAEIQFDDIQSGNLIGTELSAAVREFRSYLAHAANELGQLLHRGAGESADGQELRSTMHGVSLDDLK